MTRLSEDHQDISGGHLIYIKGSLNGRKGLKKSFFHLLVFVAVHGKEGRYLIDSDIFQYFTLSFSSEKLHVEQEQMQKEVPSTSSGSPIVTNIVKKVDNPTIGPSFADAVINGLKAREVVIKYMMIEDGINGVHPGWTNMSNEISCNVSPVMLTITVIFHDDSVSARYHYGILQKFKGKKFTFQPIFLDLDNKPKVIMERIKHYLCTFFPKSSGNDWWEGIQKQFMLIFEKVMMCLVAIHSEEIYHGNLINGIAVAMDGVIKLYNMKDLGISFNAGARTDVKALRSLMIRIIADGYPNVPQEKLYTIANIPEKVQLLLEKLGKGNVPRSFMDYAALWSAETRLIFLNRLFNLLWRDRSYGAVIRGTLNQLLPKLQWIQLVPVTGPFRSVFENAYGKNDEFEVQVYKNPVDAMRFWRNTQQHYNQYSNHFTTDVEIEEHFDTVFHICWHIVEALQLYFKTDGLSEVEMIGREYAKTKMCI